MTNLLERAGGFLPALVAVALPTVFLTIDSDSFVLPRASIVIAAACVGVGLAILLPGGLELGDLRWPLVAAACAALLAFAFSASRPLSFVGSYTRYESLPVRLSYLGLLAMGVWLLRTERQRQAVGAAFVFGATVASLEAVQQWAAHVAFRPDGNLGNANLLAALLAMAIPIAVDRALHAGWFVLAWWMAVFVLAFGIVVTTSRSGLLGSLAGIASVAALGVARRRLAIALGAAGAVVVGAAVLVIQVSPLSVLNEDPASLRLDLWRDALRMIAFRPITGWGEDTTGLVFGQFLSRDYASLVTFDRVHSGPLDLAATQGLLGVLALGAVIGVLGLRAWRHRLDPNVPGLAGALAGYSVWVLFNFDWAPATGVFWLLGGTLWAATQPALSRPVRQTSLWRPLAAVGLVGAAVALAALPVLADAWYVTGHADLAVRIDPLQAQYHWSLGQGLVAHGDLAGGVRELRRAADLGETEPALYVELGDRELQLGDRTAAREAYRQALQIDPYYTPAAQRLSGL